MESSAQHILKSATHFCLAYTCDRVYSLCRKGNLGGGNVHCTCAALSLVLHHSDQI